MKIIIFWFIFFLPVLTAGSEVATEAITDPDVLMDKANQAYTDESYYEAIALYQEILNTSLESSALYYNLGNAWFKAGYTGKAILYYERALRLDPRDGAIRHNLQLARSQITDRIDPLPRLFFHEWYDTLIRWQSPDGWARTLIGMISLMVVSVVLFFVLRYPWQKKPSFALALIFLFLALFSGHATRRQYMHIHTNKEAIVMMPRHTARSAPGERGIDVFVVHEGTKVTILNQVREWYEVRLANGNVGWIQENALEII
ncbi:MAG: tetratricopeptide repeat protein [Bacteroidia bacterium]|nr:MAG: tetratricopeptide repeat protein [Bacteroidia bacterium]